MENIKEILFEHKDKKYVIRVFENQEGFRVQGFLDDKPVTLSYGVDFIGEIPFDIKQYSERFGDPRNELINIVKGNIKRNKFF